ncbi:MAG TPA: GGDEF domain-containing protein, partial [Acetobacteraceae bacterium]|nr:GGDEF domain-containing protein [Acetobacteraceae bacterium]
MISLDLDHFKDVNDTLVHPVGDGLLREVAARLPRELRETDTAARLGGDEFAILQSALGLPRDAIALAERLIVSGCFDIAAIAWWWARASESRSHPVTAAIPTRFSKMSTTLKNRGTP